MLNEVSTPSHYPSSCCSHILFISLFSWVFDSPESHWTSSWWKHAAECCLPRNVVRCGCLPVLILFVDVYVPQKLTSVANTTAWWLGLGKASALSWKWAAYKTAAQYVYLISWHHCGRRYKSNLCPQASQTHCRQTYPTHPLSYICPSKQSLKVIMANLTHFNPKSGSTPYKSLFSNCTIVPPNTSLAYISTQWAADPKTGEYVTFSLVSKLTLRFKTDSYDQIDRRYRWRLQQAVTYHLDQSRRNTQRAWCRNEGRSPHYSIFCVSLPQT